MIPLGVLASGYVAPAGGLSVVQHASAPTNSATLPAAPTPGNRLIVTIATTTSGLTPSHTATTRDAYITTSGWYLAMWSGVVQSGASATITTATGSNLALAVWEVTPCEFEAASTYAANWTASMTLTKLADPAALGLIVVQTESTNSAAVSGGTLDSVASGRAIHAHTDTPQSTTTISWTGTSQQKQGILGVYS